MKNALKISPPRAGIFSFPLFPGILKTNENRKTKRKGSDLMVTSAHYACERAEREKRIEHINGGDGEEVARFLVDRHHPAGPEIHLLDIARVHKERGWNY